MTAGFRTTIPSDKTHFVEAPKGLPRVGEISADRVAIMGRGGHAFLFAGSSGYYGLYGTRDQSEMAEQWLELFQNRQRACRDSCQIVSMVIPNKATCMRDLYPALLPNPETPIFRRLRDLASGDPALLFNRSLLEHSKPESRKRAQPWRYIDTHWTSAAAATAFNELLIAFGLPEVAHRVVPVEPQLWPADLSSRWSDHPLWETMVAHATCDLPPPACVFDLAQETPGPSVTGRRVVWDNHEAPCEGTLLIVGNSFCYAGTAPEHLTWWAARYFRSVTFLHTADLPVDALSLIRPDFVLFQTVERFLPHLPSDRISVGELEMQYRKSNCTTPSEPQS